jgi:hypothetical protein
MSVELRILVVGFAAFATAGMAAALIVPAIAGCLTRGSGALRARRLASLRMFPSIIAAATGGVVLLAFAIFEPRQEDEYMGAAIPGLASFSLLLIAGSVWRARRLARATRALEQRWMSSATPIPLAGISVPAFAVEADFPIVAVVGWRRPRLLIARSVLASCSPDELTAVLAHEQGHIDRLAWLPVSERMLAAWREAAEDAADDDAARTGTDGRVRLASALVKVARLAPGRRASGLMPASALYSGDGLDRRVRRLLDPPLSGSERRAAPWRARVWRSALVLGGLAAAALALEGVHAAIEVAIHRLP